MNKKIFTFFIAIIFLSFINPSKAQLVTNTNLSPDDLVKKILLGKGVTATNIVYTGYSSAIGFFKATQTNLGLDSGIILTTGTVLDSLADDSTSLGPQGPNDQDGAGFDNDYDGDDDLSMISDDGTYDAAILEFDFSANSDSIKFKYIFGSDEYMEFVDQGYNDAFAFLLSGPGISGPYSNSATNIALLPDGVTPVTIDNVNADNNSQYWFDNGDGDPGEVDQPGEDGLTIQYDGFTVALTATYKISCGETYHIKIGIADADDGDFDSGVFLEAQSFAGTSFTDLTTDINVQDTLCPNRDVAISASGNFKSNSTFNWNFDEGKIVSGSQSGPYTVQWDTPGIKKIKLVVDQNSSCPASDSIFVKVSDCSVKTPNIITPNGDGKNDFFTVAGLDHYPSSHLIVYNRWGLKVFEESNYKETWDASQLEDGVYYYILNVGPGYIGNNPITGFVTISH